MKVNTSLLEYKFRLAPCHVHCSFIVLNENIVGHSIGQSWKISKSNIEILSNPAKSGQSGRIRPLFKDGNPVPVPVPVPAKS